MVLSICYSIFVIKTKIQGYINIFNKINIGHAFSNKKEKDKKEKKKEKESMCVCVNDCCSVLRNIVHATIIIYFLLYIYSNKNHFYL